MQGKLKIFFGASLLCMASTALAQAPPVVNPKPPGPVAQNFYATNSPMADVKAWGAKGDGTTDDTAAIQAAINHVLFTYGSGTVFIPSSTSVYCVKTGITVASGVSTTGGVRIVGAGVQQSVLSSCGHDVTVAYLNSPYATLENLYVLGYGFGGDAFGAATLPAVALFTNCSFCKLQHVFINGGTQNIQMQASGFLLDDVQVQYAYGDGSHGQAMVYIINGGGYIHDSHFDQVWPVSQPGHGTTPNPWGSSQFYGAGTVVSLSGFYIQASQSGTSAPTPPALRNYGTTIVDGTVHWLLVAPTTYYALQVDTGANEVQIARVDATCSCSSGVAITNTFAGTAPISISIADSTPGAVLSSGILANAGGHLSITGAEVSNCILPGCAAVAFLNNWNGPAVVNGLRVFNSVSYGILNGAGSFLTVNGSSITSADNAALKTSPGIGHFVYSANLLGAGNAAGVIVDAGGSDYYNIVNNILNGASVPISDGGTGVHKTVTGNQ